MLQGAASWRGYPDAPASPVVLTFLLAPLHPYWHPTKQGRWVTLQTRLPMLCSHSQLQDRRSIRQQKLNWNHSDSAILCLPPCEKQIPSPEI